MPNRPLMFMVTPLIAAPIVVAFLFVGGASEPPARPAIGETNGHLEPQSPGCVPRDDGCPQAVALGMRPLEC
jgi:hypothetical protein